MRTKFLFITFLTICLNMQAQNVTVNYDIRDNLDLDAVASLFGEAQSPEDFELALNHSANRISNLDLNGDGYIDYLRVVETFEDGLHVFTIQAVLGNDLYQDVAYIATGKDEYGDYFVQITGNEYLYGPDYYIDPVYVQTPKIFFYFRSPRYTVWASPYYWNYYPTVYIREKPYTTYRYKNSIKVHIDVTNTYKRTTSRDNESTILRLQGKNMRNDYADRNPGKSFSQRNNGIKNEQGQDQHNSSGPQTGRQTIQTRQPEAKPAGNQSKQEKAENPGYVNQSGSQERTGSNSIGRKSISPQGQKQQNTQNKQERSGQQSNAVQQNKVQKNTAQPQQQKTGQQSQPANNKVNQGQRQPATVKSPVQSTVKKENTANQKSSTQKSTETQQNKNRSPQKQPDKKEK